MSRKTTAVLFAALLALSACGSDDGADEDGAAAPAEQATDGETSSAPEPDIYAGPGDDSADTTDGSESGSGSAPVTVADTELGDVLVDDEGFTLYGFTEDSGGSPTCEAGCAETWPPVIVESAELPGGLDPSVFSVVERPDGSNQLKAGDWPLYTYAPDSEPGDTTGQGVGGVWFVVDPEGRLVES